MRSFVLYVMTYKAETLLLPPVLPGRKLKLRGTKIPTNSVRAGQVCI